MGMGYHSLVLAGIDGRYGRESSEEDSRLHLESLVIFEVKEMKEEKK